MEWTVAITDYGGASKFAAKLNAEFPYKSTAQWFSILTMIKYTKEMKE